MPLVRALLTKVAGRLHGYSGSRWATKLGARGAPAAGLWAGRPHLCRAYSQEGSDQASGIAAAVSAAKTLQLNGHFGSSCQAAFHLLQLAELASSAIYDTAGDSELPEAKVAIMADKIEKAVLAGSIAEELKNEERWRRRLYALWATSTDELEEMLALRGLDYSLGSQAALVSRVLEYEYELEVGDGDDDDDDDDAGAEHHDAINIGGLATNEVDSGSAQLGGESWVLGSDPSTDSSSPSTATALAARKIITDPIPEHLSSFITQLQDEHRLFDIRILPQPPDSQIGAHLVLASGQSTDHIFPAARNIARMCRGLRLTPPSDPVTQAALATAQLSVGEDVTVEGEGGTDWLVVDAGFAVFSLFTPEMRESYNLEELWDREGGSEDAGDGSMPPSKYSAVRSFGGDEDDEYDFDAYGESGEDLDTLLFGTEPSFFDDDDDDDDDDVNGDDDDDDGDGDGDDDDGDGGGDEGGGDGRQVENQITGGQHDGGPVGRDIGLSPMALAALNQDITADQSSTQDGAKIFTQYENFDEAAESAEWLASQRAIRKAAGPAPAGAEWCSLGDHYVPETELWPGLDGECGTCFQCASAEDYAEIMEMALADAEKIRDAAHAEDWSHMLGRRS